MGGGGLYGTARDYLAFLQMLMHGGEFNGARVLASGNGGGDVEEQYGRREDRVFEDGYSDRIARRRSSADVPRRGSQVGLELPDQPAAGSGGPQRRQLSWAGLANTYFWIDPSKRVAGVILTQILPFIDAQRHGPLQPVRERRVQGGVVGRSIPQLCRARFSKRARHRLK